VSVQNPVMGFGPRLVPVQPTLIVSPARAATGSVMDWVARSDGGGTMKTMDVALARRLLVSPVCSKTWLFASVCTMT
jgi:hypothetical protein